MHPSITSLYIHLGPTLPTLSSLVPTEISPSGFVGMKHQTGSPPWIIQTGVFIHSFQKLFFTCTLNTGFHLFRMSKRIPAKYKCTKLKVSAAKNHLRGILTFPSRLKERTVGMKLIWLHGCKVSLAFCYTAAEMPEPRLLSILITDYFTPQKSISCQYSPTTTPAHCWNEISSFFWAALVRLCFIPDGLLKQFWPNRNFFFSG